MNILHLEASPGWGGQEIRILREAEGMRDRSYQIYFAIMKGGKLVTKAREAGFCVYEINFYKKGWLRTFFQLLSILRKHRISLVNTHSSLDSWIGGIAARKAGVPIIRTRHLSTPIHPGWNSRVLYGKLADFIVTTCEAIVPLISEQSKKPLTQIRSVPTGVSLRTMEISQEKGEEFRKSLGIKSGEFLVGSACFMRTWKGIEDFIQAALLLKKEPNIKWMLIGGGHCSTYRQRVREKGLENQIFFTAHLDNPLAALQSLDAFALLSTAHEGVSQAILQAAYLEKPLIATPTGGLCEVCIPEKTGFLVEPFSPDQVANIVFQLSKDRALCHILGQEGKKLVLEKFTSDQMLDQMEEIYQRFM